MAAVATRHRRAAERGTQVFRQAQAGIDHGQHDLPGRLAHGVRAGIDPGGQQQRHLVAPGLLLAARRVVEQDGKDLADADRVQLDRLRDRRALGMQADVRMAQLPRLREGRQPQAERLGRAVVRLALQAGQRGAAQLQLLLDSAQVFAIGHQRRIGLAGVVLQLAGDDGHGGQRRAHLVRHAGALRHQRLDALLAQQALARVGEFGFALAQRRRQPRGEPGDHGAAGDKIDPHAGEVVRHRIRLVQQVHRDVVAQHHAVGRQRVQRQPHHMRERQHGRGDRQRGQIERHKGVGRTAREVQQRGQRGQVHQQLGGDLDMPYRAVAPHAPAGQQVEHRVQAHHAQQRHHRQLHAEDERCQQHQDQLRGQQDPSQPEQAA